MWLTNTEERGSTQMSHYHTSLNVFYHIVLDYPMASRSITDENIKRYYSYGSLKPEQLSVLQH